MGFNLKSGNNPAFKGMGSSPLKSVQSELTGKPTTGEITAKAKPKMDNDKWQAGSDAAKKNTGRSLNDLVSSRKGLEKGSNEYNKVQNEINAALGNKKRYDVAADETKTGPGGRTKETTTVGDKVTQKTTSANGNREVTKVNTPDSKSKEVSRNSSARAEREGTMYDPKGVDKTKTKTGLSTETKDDDVTTKTKRKGGVNADTKTKVKTADAVTKTVTGAKGEAKSSKTRKRLGKGLVKDVVAKAKANRANKKAGKAKGSKAPKGTTYDPSDDSSNMPV
jgi:hypothetical protein